jgi:hypothetical protein
MKKIILFVTIALQSVASYAQDCVVVNSGAITNLTNNMGTCTFNFTPTITVNTGGAAAKIASFSFTSGMTTVTVCYTGNASSTAFVLMANCADTRNALPTGGPTVLPTATISLPCGASGSIIAQNSNNGSGGVCAGPTALTLGSFPVKLAHFSAKIENNVAHLQWATSEEQNNKGFEIQKSTNAQDFKTIGFVDGAGTLQARKEYGFRDYDFVTTSYYRLKQIDHNKATTYSHVVSLIPTNESLEVVTLSPNPASQKVAITLPRNVTSLRIFNAQGSLLKEAQFDENTFQTEADVSLLPTGIYYVEFKTSHEKTIKRLVINK